MSTSLCTTAPFLSGCESCTAEKPLAKLIAKNGPVDRDKAKAQNQWLAASPGSVFEVGDAIRTGTKADARLDLDDGSILGLQEETIVRFLDRKPGRPEQALDLVMGEASLVAPEEGTIIRTAFGLAHLEGGSKVQLVRSDDALRVQVLLGNARVENNEGAAMDVSEGQIIETTLGDAVMELLKDEEQEPPGEITKEEVEAETGGPISATVRGTKVRVQAPGQDKPVSIAAGTRTLENGSIVEVGGGSSVILSRGDQTAELSKGTYVVGKDDQLVSSRSSSFVVGSERQVTIRVPGGVITTTGGRATITPQGDRGTRVEAMSGSVLLSGKTSQEMTAGEDGRIENDGSVSVTGRGLSRSDVDASAGQSLVIHDPRPPTAVGFLFGSECERGKIQLQGKSSTLPGETWARGEHKVVLPIAGRTEYQLRCIDQEGKEGPIQSRGTITVLADAGTRSVPEKAPSTSIDVNGRAYTVLYQNQLPRVTVRWTDAPANGPFVLKQSGRGVSRSYSSASASYTFAPGALGEGTHTFYFEGGGRVSRRSSVTILFDNATPTASLQTPAHTGVGPGGSLHLAGTGLPGWTVTVDGKAIAQDAEGRFSVSTSMPADGGPKAVYLSHPARGTHVYLRRPAGAK